VRINILPNSTDLQLGIMPAGSVKAYLGQGFEASETKYSQFKEIMTAHMALGADHRDYTFFISSS
jgi:hypothetical protein